MNLSFKEYLVESDTHNWVRNPKSWAHIGDSGTVAKDTIKDVPVVSAQDLWGSSSPKPMDKIVNHPKQRRVVVKVGRNTYLVDVGFEGSRSRSFKKVVKGSLLGDEQRKVTSSNAASWSDISQSVPAKEAADLPVYSADALWDEGGKATPKSKFKQVPTEKKFVAKIANARYIISLGKTPNNRSISRVSPGSVGILGSSSRRR